MSQKILEEILKKLNGLENKVDNMEKTMVTKEDMEKTRLRIEEIEKTMVTKEDMEKTRLRIEEIEKTMVTKEEMEKTRLRIEDIEKTMVTKEDMEKTMVTKEDMEKRMLTKEDMEKNTSEIAQEIRALAEMISKKSYQEQKAIRKEQERNKEEHKVFAEQMERIRLASEYILEGAAEKLA